MDQNEFKDRMQLLLAEAINLPKRQQCLIEFNRLCVQNKGQYKIIITTMETLKMNEVNMRALKIAIQVYNSEATSLAIRTAQLVNKCFAEASYTLSGECYRLLATKDTIQPLCDLLCPLALKLNSLPVQIGAIVALKYLLSFEVPQSVKVQIQQSYIKNAIVVHPALIEILIQITKPEDACLIQILQRSLAGLQEQKHSYQIKIQQCKLLQTIAQFTSYNENLLLQCITILREATLNKSLQQAAKQALQCYQNLYIAQNPQNITASTYLPDIKPFIKKKRGDNHLVLDAEKHKKMQISQLKQQIEKIQVKETEERIQQVMVDQFIQKEQQTNEQEEEEYEQEQEVEEAIQEPNLQDTQLFEDTTPMEETQDFREQENPAQEALQLVENSQIEEAFSLALKNGDDLLLLRLMMTVENYFSQLSKPTASLLIQKFNAIYKSRFIELLFKDFANEALRTPNMLKIVLSKLIAPRRVVYAVDSGSYLETRSAAGIKYKRDEQYIGTSEVRDYYEKNHKKVKFTEDQMLYLTLREGERFGYTIPIVDQNAQYVLVLKFVELEFQEAGQRVFSVFLGKKVILENIDIYKLVGDYTAHTEYIEIKIDNGVVNYQGEECKGAINNKNELVVGFAGFQEKATVAGLFLFKGPLSETDFEDKEKYQETWIKRNLPKEELKKIQEEKIKKIEEEIQEKQSILKVRDGFAHELPIEEIQTPPPQQMPWPEFSFQLLFILIQTPLGAILMVGFLTVCYVTISFVFFDPYGHEEWEKKHQERIKKRQQQVAPKFD